MALFCHTWLPCFACLILPRGFLFLFSVLKDWLRVPGGPLSIKLLSTVSHRLSASHSLSLYSKKKMAAFGAILNLLLSSNEICFICFTRSNFYNAVSRNLTADHGRVVCQILKVFQMRSRTPGTAKARISITDISRRRSGRFSLKTVLAVITTTPRKLLCVQLISRIEFIHTA